MKINNTLIPKNYPGDELLEIIEEYILTCRANGMAFKTIEGYAKRLYSFHWWYVFHAGYGEQYGYHPENITTKLVRDFVIYLREPQENRWGLKDGKKPSKEVLSYYTIMTFAGILKTFFNWLERERYIKTMPINKSVKFANKKQASRVIRTVPESDIIELFTYLTSPKRVAKYNGSRDLAIFSLLLDSGIRKGELLSMKLKDIQWETNTIMVRGKTGERVAVFSHRCKKFIQDYYHHQREAQNAAPESEFWRTSDDFPLGYGALSTSLKLIRKHTGIKFSLHQLRHTFATMMAGKVNTFELMGLLGHVNIRTTQVYVNNRPETLAEAHRGRSPLSTLNINPAGGQAKRRGRPRSSENY